MSHRVRSVFAACAVLAACSVSAVGASGRISQNAPVRPSVPPARMAPDAVQRQMHALEHRARVEMVLYKGRFRDGNLAGIKTAPNAFALTMRVGRK